ncbi:MAG: hypothetical protein OXC84_01670, partial [Gammaproteobacteria bacterium]|nr:hypothetical protein [Gammaproteobacteria bacterium]
RIDPIDGIAGRVGDASPGRFLGCGVDFATGITEVIQLELLLGVTRADNQAADQLLKARQILFKTINEQNPKTG